MSLEEIQKKIVQKIEEENRVVMVPKKLKIECVMLDFAANIGSSWMARI